MSDHPHALSLRAKIIGATIQEARIAGHKTIGECARIIGVAEDKYEAYENGLEPISLPELECIAYYLETPLDRFWESEGLRRDDKTIEQFDMAPLINLRHRMIGAILRQARLEAGISLENLAKSLEWDENTLEAYELGKQPIPVPELEVLSGRLNRSIREFFDQHGPVGEWNAQQRALRDFLEMPVEMQIFVSRPVNRLYIELAIRLSEMSVERLRAVAEGLLEITY